MKKVKRLVAFMQVVFLLAAMLPLTAFTTAVETDAAVSGIKNGGTYMIVSAYNGKAITQTDLSTFYANCVVWNTNASSDLAKWKVEETGNYYKFTNIISGKSMKICGNSNGSTCDFNGFDNSNNYKWNLEPITEGAYAGCFYISSAVLNNNGGKEYAEIIGDADKKDLDGAQVRLWEMTPGESRQIWKFVETSASDTNFTEAMADTMLQAFKNKYYVYNSNTGYNSLGGGFWGIAEVMEAMLDGYETTGKAVYRELFENTYNDFIARNGTNWAHNAYNDDITWASIASVRAYLLFGNQRYLDIAIENYNLMYNRAITYGYNMLRWCEESDKRGSTNSCINGPATVAACYLGIATGDESYFEKARSIYAAQRQYLYISEGDNAGWVYDSINMSDGSKNTWCSTYNQGTYLGSAIMLYQHYGDQMYFNDARNIMNYTLKALCYNNILKDENTNSGDLSGFRGILMRYMRKFIVDLNQDSYLSFFKDNTKVAWMNRNSQNLSQCSWQKKTSENVTWDEFAAYNSISLISNMPTYADSIIRNAYATIEAEDMDYTRGLISENSNGTSGGRSLGGVQNNHYTAYYNVNFGDKGATKATFRYSKARETDTPNSYIEIRLGSANGTLIGTANLANTGTWSDWNEVTVDITRTYGIQNIYLVYKTNTSYVCNLDCLTFSEYVEPIVYKPAFGTIEAENFDDANGVSVDATPGNIGGVNTGDWVQYNNVQFTNTAKSISITYAVQGNDASGTASVYLDSMNNAPICEMYLAPTASNNWQTYVTNKFDLSSDIAAGVHTVYIKFTADSGKGYIANVDSFKFSDRTRVQYSGDIQVIGHQISTIIDGSRVIGAVEPKIFGEEVKSWGFVYGLVSANETNYNVTDNDMFVGVNHDSVVSYESTPAGTADAIMGASTTATYFVRTMTFGVNNAIAYTAQYKVRAYAVLADGTYVYSDISDYSVYSVAEELYQKKLMPTYNRHVYLYETILKAVKPDYKAVDYNWNNTIIKPGSI